MALHDVYATRWQFRDHGRVWSVTLHYRDATGVNESVAAADLADRAAVQLAASFDGARATDSTREGIYAWKITKDTGLPDFDSFASVAGTSGEAEATSPNNCAVFTLRTEDPLATRFGRIYLAGIPRTYLEDGHWNATAMTKLNALATALKANLAGTLGTWEPCILRRYVNHIKLDPPVPSLVSDVSVTNIVYSQRRRNSRQWGTVT